MSSPKKPTIILCSGAWHTTFHIQPCIAPFHSLGYTVLPTPLLSAGSPATGDETISGIAQRIENELVAGNDIVLILHSAAGLIGTEALNRLPPNITDSPSSGKILNIMYLGSFLDWPPLVQHLMANEMIALDEAANSSTFLKPKKCFYDEISAEEAKPFVDALTWQAGAMIELSGEKWRGYRKTCVLLGKDRSVPVEMQEQTARDYEMDVVRMEDAGHCPFTTEPVRFAEFVDQVLRSNS